MTPTIRSWRADDPVLDHIAAIYREFGLVFDAGFESDLLDIGGAFDGGAFWVAEHEGRIVATAGVMPNGPARLVKRIYVAADARRLGLARHLLREAATFGSLRRKRCGHGRGGNELGDRHALVSAPSAGKLHHCGQSVAVRPHLP